MRAALGRNVAANIISAAAGIGASLISLPIILPAIGDAGYGVWTIGLTFILYLTLADAGFAPAIQRWTALAGGRGELREAGRLLWTTVALYTVVGLLAMVALMLLARPVVDLFDFPRSLRGDAVTMLRLVAVALLLALLVAGLGNVLQGLGRFVAVGLTTGAGSAVYLIAVVVLMQLDRGVIGLAEATLLQQGVVLAGRAWVLRDVLTVDLPRLLPRAQLRELALFSAKLQSAVLSALVNTQSDKVVMGLVASSATVGQLGIAGQVSDAGRLVTGAALAPVMTSLAGAVAAGDPRELQRLFGWSHRVWMDVICGGTIIGVGALYPLLAAWLGDGYGQAALLGGFLVAAVGISQLGGVALGYLRAIGRPSVEGRYGFVTVVLNVVLTVAFALAFGPVGVVAGTLGAYALATTWLFRRFGREAPETDRPHLGDAVRPLTLAAVAAALVAAVGVGITEVLPQGLALIPVGAVAALAFAIYLSLVTGRPLTPTGLRALAGGLRQPA